MDELRVDAVNPNEAIEKAMKEYLEGTLLPTSGKYVDVKFSIEKDIFAENPCNH